MTCLSVTLLSSLKKKKKEFLKNTCQCITICLYLWKKKKYNLVLLSVHFEAVIVSTIVTGSVAFK